MEILANLEVDSEDKREDELVPDMKLYQLYDMTEDLSESSKIKRAEKNLIKRQAKDSIG
ncbi:MAG: hypothetical protein OEQ12_08105 [Nitrosopumilus sp.]|nr:hypothetical protein [Nitrosopumilus sp.]